MKEARQPVVQTLGLRKVFRDFWYRPRVVAVQDLNLEIHPNEVFGLLGPNGSGKTTIIKILLGLLHPTRGQVAVFGQPPSDVQVKNRIGYLPEESYLYSFLNAGETLDFYGRLFQYPRRIRQKRTAELLEMVGLAHESRRRIGEYSKGMARRIGLAQALINDPDLLILDEPTGGLDPLGTRLIKDIILRLRDKGKTILLSSHLLADVEDVCDRVCILYGGQQRALGPVRDLLARKELTQITTDRLQSSTVEQIGELINRLEGKRMHQVSSPTDKLESLFLRTVQEAEAQQVTHAGAVTGGAMPEFLGQARPSGTEVIERLVQAGQAPAEQPAEPVAEPQPAPKQEVIAELLGAAAASEPEVSRSDQPADQPIAPPDEAQPDRSVIDALLAKRDQERRSDD